MKIRAAGSTSPRPSIPFASFHSTLDQINQRTTAMKRTLLVLLMLLIAITSAEAASTKKKKVRRVKPAPAIEATAPSPLIRATGFEPEKKQAAGPGEGVARPSPVSSKPMEGKLTRAAS